MADEQAQKLHGRGWFEPVAVLQGVVGVHGGFGVLKAKAFDAERGHVILHNLCAADGAKDDVRRDVIALRDGEVEEFAYWDVDICIRVLLLERAPRLRKDAVFRPEVDGLIQLEFALLDEVQGGDGERGLKDGLHGRMGVRVEIAVEICAGKRARDRDCSFGFGSDGGDFLQQRGLRETQYRQGAEGDKARRHVHSVACCE